VTALKGNSYSAKDIILKVNHGPIVKLFIQDQTPKGQRWVQTQQRLASVPVSLLQPFIDPKTVKYEEIQY